VSVLYFNVFSSNCAVHKKKIIKMDPPRGLGVGFDFSLSSNLIFFVTQNPMQNFGTLRKPLLGEKYVAKKKEK
jgi:hypothetical protein